MTSLGIELLKHRETNRSNLVNEAIRQGTLDETIRSNKAMEGWRERSLDETIRSNKANEAIRQEANRISNMLANETIAHNRVTEGQKASEITLKTLQRQDNLAQNLTSLGKAEYAASQLRGSGGAGLSGAEYLYYGLDTLAGTIGKVFGGSVSYRMSSN